MTRQDIEAALDQNRLFLKMRNGNSWRCRRNGKTRTWKTRPGHFYIPIKAGFKLYAAVEHTDLPTFDQAFEIK
jgi:hypothetical protein